MQYVKIKDAIVEQIETGMLSPRQKLPAERKLAESFDTTRVTLREALSLLEADGRIYREDRRGWFISPTPLCYDPSLPLNFATMATTQNRKPQTQLLAAKNTIANKQATQQLQLPPFSDVIRIDRVRYLEERPVAYVTHYVRPTVCPNLLDFDLNGSLTDIYRDHFGVQYQKVHYRMSTSSILGETAQALRATSGTPAMMIERITYDDNNERIDYSVECWRHDAIRVESMVELRNADPASR
ncbi:phosphonate utilization transcriptional regulator PhnR [Vibrio sinensis]|uniref:Phosphonate utilization transcriptional regulator PhnR n=1 Tax=Vibrio sinensis TaxID=2302434 RepID=A0A3A6QZL4_9VIBR|nr:phosphonate utilization transcriptional regulator PhnR [Vibrio sinensis]RJX74297.1 phosphonate utilization transcriptional regulator PhnR [Vibrio sinensis]